jgi:RPA family protein
VNVVDKDTRDLWTLDTAARTLDRVDALATGTSPDILKAKEQYPSLDPAVFRKMAYDALAQIKM